MSSAAPASVTLVKPSPPPHSAVAACFLAGHVHVPERLRTQPLLPYLQRIYNTSEIEVSMTVSATILAVALIAPFVGLMAESIGRKKVIVPSPLRADRAHPAGSYIADPETADLLALHAGTIRARRDRGHHGLHRRGVRRIARWPRDVGLRLGHCAGRIRRALHLRTDRAPLPLASTPSSSSGSLTWRARW